MWPSDLLNDEAAAAKGAIDISDNRNRKKLSPRTIIHDTTAAPCRLRSTNVAIVIIFRSVALSNASNLY